MDIAQIMQRLEANQQADAGVKTASATPSATHDGDALRDELRQAVRDATGEAKKTASAQPAAPAPATDLVKMAADLADAEEAAIMKQAQLYGAAIADGFMTRYAQYETAASEVAPTPMKTAAVAGDFEKFAADNPELTREAYELGYRTKMAELQKTAEEEFTTGYNDTIRELHKTAADVYKHGVEWGTWAIKTAEQAQAQ